MISRQRRSRVTGQAPSNGIATWRGGSPQHLIFYTLLAFLLTCLLGGGADRTDVWSLLYLRPITVICLITMVVIPTVRNFGQVQEPLLLLGALALVILVQLVPLPPSVWTKLPGHAPLAAAAAALDDHQPWRPISLTPDLTLNSLLALLVPLTVLVGFSGIRADQQSALVPLMVSAAVASAGLGVLQYAGGQDSWANLYAIHSLNVPNGVFANRNHHGVFLACGLVLVATWLRLSSRHRSPGYSSQAIAGLVALVLLAVAIATGSRSGTLLALLALAYGATTAAAVLSGRGEARRAIALWGALVAVVLLLVAVMLLAGRAVSLDRLFGFDPTGEQRLQALPTLLVMWRDLMPVGSGFGSFDQAFRMYEPDAMLGPTYFNHAHDDWLELGITGGLPALVLLALFAGWVAVRLVQSFRLAASSAVLRARAGGVIILLLGAASVSDYPLRTPLLAALAALACAWLANARGEAERSSRPGAGR